MTIASIDLGSNSVILLIAEYDINSQKLINYNNYYTTPKISENITQTGLISQNALFRLDQVLNEFSSIIKDNNCEVVLVKATNAFRIASNSLIIKNNFENKYKWNITILSGEVEAQLSFIGTILPNNYNSNSLLIDIGGGSTEFIYGNNLSIKYRNSIQLGVVSLYENFFKNKTTSKVLLKSVENYIANKLCDINIHFDDSFNTLAVAGTPTTLSAIAYNVKKYSDELVDNTTLTLEQITTIRKILVDTPIHEMQNEFGDVVTGREELILGGSIILECIMKHFRIEQIIVSTKGLRYGAIYDYLINNNLYTRNNW